MYTLYKHSKILCLEYRAREKTHDLDFWMQTFLREVNSTVDTGTALQCA